MKSKLSFLLIISLLLLSLTGCFDKTELENRGFAISVGIDKLDEKDNSDNNEQKAIYPNRYNITLALPKLASFASNDGGGGEEATLIKKNKAPTVPGGMITANDNSSKKLDYTQMKLILFGSEMLKDKKLFKEALDGLERVHEINRRVLVMATGGSAEDVISAKTNNTSMLGFFVSDFYENNSKKSAATFSENLERVLKQLRDNGCAIIPRIEIKDEDVSLEGAALLNDYQIVGWLSPSDTTQILFLGEEGVGVELLTMYNDILLKCRVLKQSTKFEFSEVANNLKMTLNVDVIGEIEEYIFSDEQLFDDTKLQEFGKLYETQLNTELKNTLESIRQTYKADFFHIEQILSKRNYKLWQKYKDNWQSTFENMEIEVKSDVSIGSLGVTK